MNTNLLILGGGQYGSLVCEIAESIDVFGTISFLDDGVCQRAIGTFSDARELTQKYSHAIVALGNSKVRLFWIEKLLEWGYVIPTLIHSTAYVSPSASIGIGSIIEPMAVVNTGAVIGKGCLVSAGAVINHNAIVEDGCHIDCNATVSARDIISQHTKIPSPLY